MEELDVSTLAPSSEHSCTQTAGDLVASWPELTPEQRAVLASLLTVGRCDA